MHKNRSLPLEFYQKKLEERVNSLAFLLFDKTTEKPIIFKPEVKSMFHPKFMEGYFRCRQAKLLNHFKSHKVRMLTLTYDTKLYSPVDVAKFHKIHIKKFVRKMREIYGQFEYAYFIELTDKLYIHYHIYIDRFYPVEKMQQIWKDITGSIIVHVKEIKTEKQKYYCANYHSIMKKFPFQKLDFAFRNVSRFFGQSRHFFETKDIVEPTFGFIGRLFDAGFDWREKLGIINFNHSILIAIDELNELFEDVHWLLKLHDNELILHGIGHYDLKEPPPF